MKSVILFLLFFSISAIAQQNYDDVVYLKNGSVIRGVIVEQVPNVSLKLQTKDGNIFVYKMEEVERITKEQAQGFDQQSEYYAGSEKSPGLAFALSFLIPGLGQYYNGDIVKGVVMNSLYVTGLVISFTVGYEEYEWLGVGLGIALGTSIWSMIDAPICASNYNDELRKSRKPRYGHMYESYLNDRVVLGIDLSPTLKGFAGGITLHF